MAFFDQLGKQISNAGKNVAQQTKNLADSTLLQNSISEKQKTAQQLYANLGQLYYDVHKDDPEASGYQTMCQITKVLAEINQCREQLSRLRGNSICPNCGTEIAGDSQFCRGCGSRLDPAVLPASPAPEGNVCPQCGTRMPAGNLFCTICGCKLS